MDVLVKTLLAALLAIVATALLAMEGYYWYGAYSLPKHLPLPPHEYSADAHTLLWSDLGGRGEIRIRRFSSVGIPLTELGHFAQCRFDWTTPIDDNPACRYATDETALDLAAADIAFLQLARADRRLGPNLKYGRQAGSSRPWPARLPSVKLAVASRLSREWPEGRILDSILENADFGRKSMGLEQAAQTYFGVSAARLTIAETAALVVLSSGPAYYDPACHPDAFRLRYLRLMLDNGYRVNLRDPDADLLRMQRGECGPLYRFEALDAMTAPSPAKQGFCERPD
ncbi:MAG: transglycosylase domain-containing protein [Lysobacter sp.]